MARMKRKAGSPRQRSRRNTTLHSYCVPIPRIMWPLEAKVIRSKGNVAPYVREIKDNYLTCRYAPFSREGAMLGYLLVDDTGAVFKSIAEIVPCTLKNVSSFKSRAHKFSSHSRTVPAGKNYPARFKCHHLLMVLTTT